MPMTVTQTDLPGVILIAPPVFADDRGYFLQTFHQPQYREAGIDLPFVQDNHSHSAQGVLRGLHYQLRKPQGKLIHVVRGEIFDVAVDIRRGSPTFGRWTGVILSEHNHHQLYVPPGFAHGFCVRSQTADVIYKCTDVYNPGDEYGILWSDPELAIDWQLAQPRLSPKDAVLKSLAAMPQDCLPLYED